MTAVSEELRKNFVEEIKAHYAADIEIIRQIDGEFVEAFAGLKPEDVGFAEQPTFRKYDFSGVLFGAVMADVEYYDWDEHTKKRKPKTISYLNALPFSGKYWLMENAKSSDVSTCRRLRAKAIETFKSEAIGLDYVKFEFYSVSEKMSAAKKVAWQVAEDFVFASTAHLPTRGYVEEWSLQVNENFTCTPSSDAKTVTVNIIPVYIKLKSGKKLFVGAYLPDEEQMEIYLYDEKISARKKEIEEENLRKARDKKRKRKLALIIAAVCVLVVGAIVGINVAALSGALK